MKCATIQQSNIMAELLQTGEYRMGNKFKLLDRLRKPYKFMMQEYNYLFRPIFLCPVGFKVDFSGAAINETSLLLVFDIPESFLKIQNQKDWTYFMHLMSTGDSLADAIYKDKDSIETFGKRVLTEYPDVRHLDEGICYQVTSVKLQEDWLIDVKTITHDFIGKYINSNGNEVLKF